MSNAILVIGESGSGKSTSMKNLPPEKTFIINCIGKQLPFKGWKGGYKTWDKDNPQGNYFSSDNPEDIIRVLGYIDEKRPEIEYIVIDDYIYTMTNEYMRRTHEAGFEKFRDIGKKAWSIANEAKNLRDNLNVGVLTHSEDVVDASGTRKQKAKTVGKMIDNVVNLEGMFTIVLYTEVVRDGKKITFNFLTKNNGSNTAKSPDGMFESDLVPNDLLMVFQKIEEYNLD